MRAYLNVEVFSGLLFILIGSVFLFGTVELPYGTWRKIGPGGFPALVAGLLILMGLIVSIRGIVSASHHPEVPRFHFNKLSFVVASLVSFGLTIRGAGMLPAIMLSTIIVSRAVPRQRCIAVVLYGLCLGAVSSLVFVTALGMTVAILGPWFGF